MFSSLTPYQLVNSMALSKKDMARKKSHLNSKLEMLEKKAKADPLKRDRALHEEIAEIRKKLGQ